MKIDEGDLAAAALYAAQSTMFSFMIAALKMCLKQERMGGFTPDGRQIEPPIAHLVRPTLATFLSRHQSVDADPAMDSAQRERADDIFRKHLQELQEQVLDAIRPYEI